MNHEFESFEGKIKALYAQKEKAKGTDERTALVTAAKENQLEVVAFLIEHGADINAKVTDESRGGHRGRAASYRNCGQDVPLLPGASIHALRSS